MAGRWLVLLARDSGATRRRRLCHGAADQRSPADDGTAAAATRNAGRQSGGDRSIYQAGSSRTLFEIGARVMSATRSPWRSPRTPPRRPNRTTMSRRPAASTPRSARTSISPQDVDRTERQQQQRGQCKGDAAANNVFTGTITVTVIEVLANGNLLVSGEKQVAIAMDRNTFALSGIVNPYFVNAYNTIAFIADRRRTHRVQGKRGDQRSAGDGLAGPVFLTVLPF